MAKKMWVEYPEIWKSESAFMSWIRGGIRRSLWNRHPVKLEFIKNKRQRIPNPNPRGKVKEVWGGTCALTGEVCVIANLEVDHKTGGHSLRTIEDIRAFIEGIVFITEKDLQFVSKSAHKIKSYAEKEGLTFEEARIVKQAIETCKLPKDKLLAFCAEHGYSGDCVSNDTKRRQVVETILKEKL